MLERQQLIGLDMVGTSRAHLRRAEVLRFESGD